ncbi:amidohydrolase family protein [Sorangium sp. So ce131]
MVEHLVACRWPFRLHATYDESITRMLDVFEAVNRKIPFAGLRWFFDHAETVSARTIDRIAELGGGIAIQHRMAYQGEHFLHRYGPEMTSDAPPVRRRQRVVLRRGRREVHSYPGCHHAFRGTAECFSTPRRRRCRAHARSSSSNAISNEDLP